MGLTISTQECRGDKQYRTKGDPQDFPVSTYARDLPLERSHWAGVSTDYELRASSKAGRELDSQKESKIGNQKHDEPPSSPPAQCP